MTAAAETESWSVECALARKPGYEQVHAQCRQLQDVPLPHGNGVLLARRCRCACHQAGAA